MLRNGTKQTQASLDRWMSSLGIHLFRHLPANSNSYNCGDLPVSHTLNSEIKDTKTDISTKENFSKGVLKYLYLYSGGVGVFILASGFLNAFGNEIFSEPVLLALVGSTTIMALGLVGISFYGLSHNK